MKILVVGAGVLGSYLAHVLQRGGNVVTLLARGERLVELQKKGLVIRHYLQLKTTVDRVKLTDHFDAADHYAIVFVVVQRSQLDELLPQLCDYEGGSLFVLIGNNATANETQQYIQSHSRTPKQVIFGFQGTGGRREKGRVVSISMGAAPLSGRLMVGSLDGDHSYQPMLTQAFAGTHYQLRFCENMDAWLKCHLVFIMPLVFACYYANGDLRKIAGDRVMLNRLIDCMDEGYQIVEACGYPITPAGDDDFVRKTRGKCYWFLKLMAATPIGKLACSDHAMAAKHEMIRLKDDFGALKRKAAIATPVWDAMEGYLPVGLEEDAS